MFLLHWKCSKHFPRRIGPFSSKKSIGSTSELCQPNLSFILCEFGSTILGRTTHEWREKLLCVARIHGSNLCHACSVGDTSGGSRYFLDQSTEDPNHYPTGLDKNHNFPDVITSCGSSAHRYLTPCSSHSYGHCPSCAALSTLLVWSFPRKTCRSFWGIWLFYWLEFNYLDKLTIQVSLRSVYWTVFCDDLVGGLKVKVESIKAGDICKIITWHYWLI